MGSPVLRHQLCQAPRLLRLQPGCTGPADAGASSGFLACPEGRFSWEPTALASACPSVRYLAKWYTQGFAPAFRAFCSLALPRAGSRRAHKPRALPRSIPDAASHNREAEPSYPPLLHSLREVCWRDREGGKPFSNSPLLESVAPCSGTLLLLSAPLLLLILAFASVISVPRCTT